MEHERAPESVGVVHVTVVSDPHEAEGEHQQGDSLLQAGALDGSVVLAFAVDGAVVSLALTTRQAYHLSMAVLRCRAAIARAAKRASN